MSDLITRARKEWVEDLAESQWEARGYVLGCPPEVVAALLDLLREAKLSSVDTRPAEAAIAKALEGQ